MSENLFKKLETINQFLKSQSWLTKPIYYFLDKWTPTETKEDLPWYEESDLVILEQTPVRARLLLYTIAVTMLLLVLWAFFAKVDEVVRGDGRVIPSKQVQVIQSLDGGIVSEILVSEGESVAVGTPLIRIDETRAISSLRENQSQYLAHLAKQYRLRALAEGTSFNPPDEVRKEVPETYDQEYALYNSSKEELQSAIEIARDQVVQREKELLEVQFRKEIAEKIMNQQRKSWLLINLCYPVALSLRLIY